MILSAGVLVLGLWTGLDPLIWERVEINAFTGESIGRCASNNIGAFIGPLAFIMVVPTALTGYMAWKTKDVDDAYTESWWIFTLFLVQLELLIIAAPIIAILRDLSTEGKYFGFVIVLWAFPLCTLGLIMLPKYLAFRKAETGGETVKAKRGQRSGVRVSGMDEASGASSGAHASGTYNYSHNSQIPSIQEEPSSYAMTVDQESRVPTVEEEKEEDQPSEEVEEQLTSTTPTELNPAADTKIEDDANADKVSSPSLKQ